MRWLLWGIGGLLTLGLFMVVGWAIALLMIPALILNWGGARDKLTARAPFLSGLSPVALGVGAGATTGALWAALFMTAGMPRPPATETAQNAMPAATATVPTFDVTPRPTTAPPTATATRTPIFSAGDTVKLRGDAGKMIPVAATQEALEALNKAQRANDNIGVNELIITGKIFTVEGDTPALVLDRDGILDTQYHVRIHDGRHVGKAGWVPAEWVQ